jgi:hypothetical protein
MLRHISVKYDNNNILHRLPIFRISFTQPLTLTRNPSTSDQMHPSFTYGIHNDHTLHVKVFMTRE